MSYKLSAWLLLPTSMLFGRFLCSMVSSTGDVVVQRLHVLGGRNSARSVTNKVWSGSSPFHVRASVKSLHNHVANPGTQRLQVPAILEFQSEHEHPLAAGAALDFFELLKAGDNLLRDGDVQGAVSVYGNAIAADPKSKVAYTKRAAAAAALGHLNAAVRDYSTALELESSTTTKLHRGQLHLRICNFNDAEADFDAVLAAKPGHDGALQGKEKVAAGRSHLSTAEVRTLQ
jgi:tetratricopeptide (TPR) repeat protein